MKIAIEIILAIGVVIFVHELGHFIVAKLRGVKVVKFSLGFGTKIIGVKKGDTEYVISALPLGGYVKMAGEELGEPLTGEKWEFFSQPWWSKILIVVFGPIMNFIFAFLVFTLIFLHGVEVPTFSPVIGGVEKGSIAEKLGIKERDKILSVDGKVVNNWYDFEENLIDKEELSIKFLRDAKEFEIKINIKKSGNLGLYPFSPPVIGRVNPRSPAYKSGLKKGDEIIKIGDKNITQWIEIADVIQKSANKKLTFKVKRNEEILTKDIIPMNDGGDRGIIGILAKTTCFYKIRYGVLESIENGFKRVVFLTVLTLDGLVKVIKGKISFKDSVGGPIAIVQFAVVEAQKGLISLLNYFGYISLALGLMNLFPIPLVDGGYILVFLIEGIRRKRLSIKFMQVFQQVGFVIIIFLALFATYNDILGILNGLWNK